MRYALAALLVFLFAPAALACPNFITDYGADPTWALDNTPAWNQAMTKGCLYIPAGDYAFFTEPDPITKGTRVYGDSRSQTVLIKEYADGFFIKIQGFSGAALERMSVSPGVGSSGGIGLYIDNADGAQGFITLRDLVVNSGPGSWHWPLYVDGDMGSSPPGIRDMSWLNVTVFIGLSGSVWIKSVKDFQATDLSAYGAVYIAGTPANPSTDVRIYGNVDVGPYVSNTLGYFYSGN